MPFIIPKIIKAVFSFTEKHIIAGRYVVPIVCYLSGLTSVTLAQNSPGEPTARDIRGAAPVVPLISEPPPKLVVDAPLPGPLSFGRVVVQYRTENLRIVPVFGPAALGISPRIGHVHITVDDASWHWADASGEPLILNGFKPGPHRVLIEMTDPTHKVITGKTVNFVIPAPNAAGTTSH